MALTLEADQKLEAVGLTKFFEKDKDAWRQAVKDTKDFVKSHFPDGAKIRPDDVAKGLVPILEVHEQFKEFLDQHKLRGKFWIKDFADLMIDRTWDKLDGGQA